jgi:hypothetical protein
MDIMDLLKGQLSQGLIENLSAQIGASPEQTASATSGVMGTLMAALARNAATPQGASALNNALDRDHDGSILNDVIGMVTGQAQPATSRAVDGSGILGHILGDRQSGATDMISKMSGLNSNQAGSLMAMLAPVIMGALGKAKREQGLDAGGLTDLLGNAASAQQNQNPAMSLITRFLDSDGDGSIIDDVAGMGMKILGGLFGGKK